MTGRPAKPTALKLVHGDRKDRINTDAPVPDSGEVVPPYQLTKKVQAEWDRLAPELIRKKLLTPWDVDAFAMFCELLVLNRQAMTSARRGILVTAARRTDGKVYNRAMQGVRETAQLLATIGGKFGWTPADRDRLSISGGSNGDDKAFFT